MRLDASSTRTLCLAAALLGSRSGPHRLTPPHCAAFSVATIAASAAASSAASATPTAVDITFDDDDAFGRARYVGEAIRSVPHGMGEMAWRLGGNYRRFKGRFEHGEMRDGKLWFGANGESTYQ